MPWSSCELACGCEHNMSRCTNEVRVVRPGRVSGATAPKKSSPVRPRCSAYEDSHHRSCTRPFAAVPPSCHPLAAAAAWTSSRLM